MSENSTSYRGRVKYDEAASRRYQHHKPGKHRAEMRLVQRAMASVPRTHRVLDVPCGGGRVTLLLAQEGFAVTAADLSEAMLSITRENVAAAGLDCPVVRQDIEALTFADRAFDTVISFRLFHHFPTPEIRQKAVTELCRVARKYVALSYFSPWSYTAAKRWWRAKSGGRVSEKHHTPLAEVEGYFRGAGFRLVRDFARMRLVHTLHLALFERLGEQAP